MRDKFNAMARQLSPPMNVYFHNSPLCGFMKFKIWEMMISMIKGKLTYPADFSS